MIVRTQEPDKEHGMSIPAAPTPHSPPPRAPARACRVEDVPRWDIDTDVAVIGFGAAGSCAAIEARPHVRRGTGVGASGARPSGAWPSGAWPRPTMMGVAPTYVRGLSFCTR